MQLLILFSLAFCTATAVGPPMNQQLTLFDLIQNQPDLSEFFNLISRNELVPTLLKYRQATVFAPNNLAMKNFMGVKDQDLLLYHLANVALTTDKMDQSVSSELSGNPPLWVARRDINAYQYDLYINNAKVLRGNINATSLRQDEQVLHIIDAVLEPMIPTSRDPILSNPTAGRFLEQAGSFSLGTHQIHDFVQQVNFHNRMHVFNSPGRFTFLIPINRPSEPILREKIDAKVIDGHVIPNVVLFSRPAVRGRAVQTLAFSDNLKVTVSFTNVSSTQSLPEHRVFVQSNTLLGDYLHPRGVVMAQIVKANIPVRNGVVHLIDKPLVVVEGDVVNFLKERNGRLSEFYRILKDHATSFMDDITRAGDITLLAPSNEALRRLGEENLNLLIANKNNLTRVLQLHLIPRRLSSDEIIRNSLQTHVESSDRNRRLFFNAFGPDDNITLTVEGGGVNATVVQPDIGALNGIIHIIDRVLGIPSSSMVEKLSTDPMMSKTYALTLQRDFISRLNYTDPYKPYQNRKNTFFVPSDDAWENVHRTMASGYKKLFMGEFSHNVHQILERHLLVGQELKIEDLINGTRDGYLQTIRGRIKMTVNESGGEDGMEPLREYYVQWEDIRARIIRPDVLCTDGVIHVIDHVLVQRREIVVSGQIQVVSNSILILSLLWISMIWRGF